MNSARIIRGIFNIQAFKPFLVPPNAFRTPKKRIFILVNLYNEVSMLPMMPSFWVVLQAGGGAWSRSGGGPGLR